MLTWMLLVLAFAVVLLLGIERLLSRLGIRRANPNDALGGFRDVLARVAQRHRRG